jgi:hypothetical protein
MSLNTEYDEFIDNTEECNTITKKPGKHYKDLSHYQKKFQAWKIDTQLSNQEKSELYYLILNKLYMYHSSSNQVALQLVNDINKADIKRPEIGAEIPNEGQCLFSYYHFLANQKFLPDKQEKHQELFQSYLDDFNQLKKSDIQEAGNNLNQPNNKHWVLVAKRHRHSYLILGKGQQITSTFGFYEEPYTGKFELSNEDGIFKLNPERSRLFTHKQSENNYPTVNYKGFELSEDQYKKFCSTVASINPNIPRIDIENNEARVVPMGHQSDSDKQKSDTESSKSVIIDHNLRKKLMPSNYVPFRWYYNCRHATLNLLKEVGITDSGISHDFFSNPSSQQITLDENGTLKTMPVLQPCQTHDLPWTIRYKRFIKTAIATVATLIFIAAVSIPSLTLTAGLILGGLVLGGSLITYVMNRIFDHHPVFATLLGNGLAIGGIALLAHHLPIALTSTITMMPFAIFFAVFVVTHLVHSYSTALLDNESKKWYEMNATYGTASIPASDLNSNQSNTISALENPKNNYTDASKSNQDSLSTPTGS